MNLDGLLTFFGLLAAALAIMGRTQRRAAALFVPKWLLPVSILAALLLLVLRDMPLGIPTIFGWRLDLVSYLLTLGAFIAPVAAALISWKYWHEARLLDRNLASLEPFLQSALQQGEFDEVDRILHRNLDRLPKIPAEAAALLFDPRVVSHLDDGKPFISDGCIWLETMSPKPKWLLLNDSA
ncbi:MAG: hypothetical protein ACP5E5_04920 [Acidobacteriaceae bacterium]